MEGRELGYGIRIFISYDHVESMKARSEVVEALSN
jgi:hypothetical protein